MLVDILRDVAGIVLQLGQKLVFAVIVAALLLLDSPRLSRLASGGLGSENPVFREAPAIARAAVTYFTVRIRVNAVTAVGCLVLMLVLGVDDALLWAVGAFFLSFVPYLGLVLAMIPPAILALAEIGPLAAPPSSSAGPSSTRRRERPGADADRPRPVPVDLARLHHVLLLGLAHRPGRGAPVDAHHRARRPRPPAQRADPVGGGAAHARGRGRSGRRDDDRRSRQAARADDWMGSASDSARRSGRA